MITRRQFMLGVAGGLAGAAGLGSYAFALEPRFRLVVTEWTLATQKWPHERPLRIEAIVDAANRLDGDIIVLLGDFVAGLAMFRTAVVPPREWAGALGGLRAPLGVHAIPGNHDWWEGIDDVTGALEAAGIAVYQNRAARIGGPAPFWLAGTDSMFAGRASKRRYGRQDDLPGTLAQIHDDTPAILMAHEPDLFVDVPDRFAVTLSGHTHGGQVQLPILGRP